MLMPTLKEVLVVSEAQEPSNMSEDRIEKIKERMKWLTMELTHQGYHDGYSLEGFRKELAKLIDELKELQADLDNK